MSSDNTDVYEYALAPLLKILKGGEYMSQSFKELRAQVKTFKALAEQREAERIEANKAEVKATEQLKDALAKNTTLVDIATKLETELSATRMLLKLKL